MEELNWKIKLFKWSMFFGCSVSSEIFHAIGLADDQFEGWSVDKAAAMMF